MEHGDQDKRISDRSNKGKPPPRLGDPIDGTQRKGTKKSSQNINDSMMIQNTEREEDPLSLKIPLHHITTHKSTNSSKSVTKSSTHSHQSKSKSMKKFEIKRNTNSEINKLEEEEEELQKASSIMLVDIQTARADIADKQKIVTEDPEGNPTRLKELEMLEMDLKGKRTQFEKFKIEMDFRIKSIQRQRNFITERAKLETEKIDLDEQDKLDSQLVSDEEDDENNSLKKTGDWIKNPEHRQKDPENLAEDLMKKVDLERQRNANQKSEEQRALAEQLRDLKARDAAHRIAQEKASKLKHELANLEEEEAKKIEDWEKSQQAIKAKKQQLQNEAHAAEEILRATRSSGSTEFPKANSAEEMMYKFFDMQIKMMDQGSVPQRQSSSTFLARQSHAKELPYFGGRPEEWPTFAAEFERSSTDCAFSNSENMSRLKKCLKGEALKTVQCLMIAPENLPKVLKTLKDRFGQPEHVIEAMINKAKTVPTIKEDRLETFIEFGTAVQNVTMTITALKQEEHLNNPQLLRELEAKLPVALRMNWMRWINVNTSRKKNLVFFSEWLEQETEIACQLCPPKPETEERKKNFETGVWKRRRKDTVLATSNIEENKGRSYQNSQKNGLKPKEKTCAFCSNIGHRVAQCKEFEKQDLNTRWKLVKDKKLCFACLIYGHDIKACRTKRACGLDGCDQMHHRLLHKQKEQEDEINVSTAMTTSVVGHAGNVDSDFQNCHILPVRLQGPNGTIHTFAMMDNGSNITLIKSSMANKLGLKGPTRPLKFQGLHPIAQELQSQCVQLNIMPSSGEEIFGLSNVRTIDNLPLPQQSIRWKSINRWKHLEGLGIKAYEKAQPEILIGNDHLRIMVVREVREGPPNAPVAVRTNLGWTLLTQGDIPNRAHHSFLCHEKDHLHQLVKDYYTTESFGVKILAELPRSKEDNRAQQIMDSTMKRVGKHGQRWETGLLWKTDDVQLPESKSNALNRLKSTERKIDKNPKYAIQYYEKMQHYFDKGFAKKLSFEEAEVEGPRTWYLPHFGTSKPSKPEKIRLVFDAAAKSHGVCLNDTLLKGADQVNPLPSVLYKFRQRAVGITGDIREMFHQVNIRKEDQDSLRFLWRGNDRVKEPEVYQMQVMVFGSACSPACAQEAKNRNAKENMINFPVAANAIIYKHFVDDYLDSLDTSEEASQIIEDVVQIHLKAGFEIVNFISNSKEVMNRLPKELKAAESKIIDPESKKMERVLGLNWDPESDQFTFTTNFHRVDKEVISGKKIPTKREALSLIMSIYDPLGFLAHFTIKARIQLQETWRSEVGWDDQIPPNTHEKWLRWIEELQRISTFRLSRCYDVEFSKSESVQLHILCDASEQAFAVVAYFRITTTNGIKVAFVSAKARVAPLKTLCMPRMELQAAVLGVRLANSIKEQHEIKPTETHYWTDSEVAYCWVRSDGKKCPQFVSHRIGEIQESSDAKEWKRIPTKLNVADEATRDNCSTHWDPDSRWV